MTTRLFLASFALLAALACGPPPAWAADRSVATAREALYADYARRLAELAEWCVARGFDQPAKTTRDWLPKRAPTRLTLFVIDPTASDSAGPAGAADAKWADWDRRFRALRADQGAALWKIAQQALDAGQVDLTLQLATETLREDPNHADARRLLGFQQVDGRWQTDFARRKRSQGLVWHSRFGWLKKEDVPRYEAGQRRSGRGWVDAAEDRRRRSKIGKGWRIETDHYRVTTDASLEAGVELAERLERFYQIWQQVFASYSLDTVAVKGLRQGRGVPPGRSHSVYYFGTRTEYNQLLRARQPRIDMTLGIYFDQLRRSYFFAGADQSAGTLHHEATHQLFHETRRVARRVGRRNNFWIIEGVATYMESLTDQNGYWTLGGMTAGRVPAARQRLLDDGFYVPLAELTRLGMDSLQQQRDLGKLYSQMAGLTTFLVHYDRGRYRRGLAKYLAAVYADAADVDTLARLTGTTYAVLDRQYREFLEQGR